MSATAGGSTDARVPSAAVKKCDVSYGAEGEEPTRARSLDLYIPGDTTPASAGWEDAPAASPFVVVYVHGGAWVDRDKGDYEGLARLWCRWGYAVAVINYRLSAHTLPLEECSHNSHTHPMHAEDCADAIRWVLEHAPSYGLPKRVLLVGHSAGGFLIGQMMRHGYLCGGGEGQDLRQHCVGCVGIEGIYDLPLLVRRYPSYLKEFVDVAFGEDERTWEEASPTSSPNHMVHEVPCPWLLLHSTQDELVHEEQSEAYQAKACGWAQLCHITGTHWGVVEAMGEEQSEVSRHIAAFFKHQASALA